MYIAHGKQMHIISWLKSSCKKATWEIKL